MRLHSAEAVELQGQAVPDHIDQETFVRPCYGGMLMTRRACPASSGNGRFVSAVSQSEASRTSSSQSQCLALERYEREPPCLNYEETRSDASSTQIVVKFAKWCWFQPWKVGREDVGLEAGEVT
jgi:hypothetical protein